MTWMDFKTKIGSRIRDARKERGWSLQDLARETGDVLTFQRIAAYETGERMPGPQEIVILSKALGKRAAYLMCLEDSDVNLSPTEERLIKNWRKLSEKERMEHFRHVESAAVLAADSIPDQRLQHLSAKGKTPAKQPARHQRAGSK